MIYKGSVTIDQTLIFSKDIFNNIVDKPRYDDILMVFFKINDVFVLTNNSEKLIKICFNFFKAVDNYCLILSGNGDTEFNQNFIEFQNFKERDLQESAKFMLIYTYNKLETFFEKVVTEIWLDHSLVSINYENNSCLSTESDAKENLINDLNPEIYSFFNSLFEINNAYKSELNLEKPKSVFETFKNSIINLAYFLIENSNGSRFYDFNFSEGTNFKPEILMSYQNFFKKSN